MNKTIKPLLIRPDYVWIQTPEAISMREFNRALEIADSFCPFELAPEQLYAWLRSKGYKVTAAELKLAGQAVGYFKG